MRLDVAAHLRRRRGMLGRVGSLAMGSAAMRQPDPQWEAQYAKHIKSARWRNMKRDIGRLRGNRCERCRSTFQLQLHHKTYERLGRESPSDLELLCTACHTKADKERDAATRQRGDNTRYANAVDTYARKKYGEEYEGYIDDQSLVDEFDEWLERKGEEW
jgi:5-methylcytosine-specific restriction endonuclease McrA